MSFLRVAARAALPRIALVAPRTQNLLPFRARYSAGAGLAKEAIQTRILDVLKSFEKVDPAKVSLYTTRLIRPSNAYRQPASCRPLHRSRPISALTVWTLLRS